MEVQRVDYGRFSAREHPAQDVSNTRGQGTLPNIKSASKRLRQSRKRRLLNREVRAEIRTRTKKLLNTTAPDEAAEAYRQIASLLDRAARRGIVPRNTASRRKSRLHRYVSGLRG